MAGGGQDDLTVRIGATNETQGAVDQAIGNFSDLAAAIQKNADQIVGALAPIEEMLATLVGSLTELGTQGEAAGSELGAGLQEGAAQGTSAMAELRDMASTLGDQFTFMAGGLKTELGGAFEHVTGVMGGFLTQMWAVTGGMASMQIFNQATQWVQNFASGLFDLNNTMERTQTGWGYMFGHMVNGKDVTGVSQDLMKWTKQYSMQLPFTRQDMLSAISMLAPMGLSEQGVKDFLPTLADLTSTYGAAKGLTLTQAAQAVMGANFGLTRMLRYDLMINPQQLVPYGLAVQGSGMGERITDPRTLLPALQAFAKAQGLSGSAQYAATHNMWGLTSSFIDRIQNFQLDAGGQGFKAMEKDLKDLSNWWDSHQTQIQAFAQVFANDLANGVRAATLAFQGFVQGLQNSAFGQEVMQGFANAGKWLSDPKTQAQISQLGKTIGHDVGDTIHQLGITLGDIKTDADDAKTALDQFGKLLSGTGIKFDFWLTLDDQIKAVGDHLKTLAAIMGDFSKMMNDLDAHNWGAAAKDYAQLQIDGMKFAAQGIAASPAGIAAKGVAGIVTGGNSNSDTYSPTGQYPTNAPPPPGPIPSNEHWVKGSDGYWHLVPVGQSKWTPTAGGGGSGHGFDIFGLGNVVSNVAGTLAQFTNTNPMPVQIVSVSGNAGSTIHGPSYSNSFGNVQQITNIFGAFTWQLQQLVTGLESKQASETWALQHVAGLAGTVFGAIGGLIP